jgi:death-on-curing protein
MRLLTLEQVLILHKRLIAQSGGADGIRDRGCLESAIAQPFMSYSGVDLYPSLLEKVAALGFSLINNHPFIDGNKRIGHAAIEVTLLMNGHEIESPVDSQEAVILAVAAGQMSRESFLDWLTKRVKARK